MSNDSHYVDHQIEYINENQIIMHSMHGNIKVRTVVNGNPSLENCKTFIEILLLEKHRKKG